MEHYENVCMDEAENVGELDDQSITIGAGYFGPKHTVLALNVEALGQNCWVLEGYLLAI